MSLDFWMTILVGMFLNAPFLLFCYWLGRRSGIRDAGAEVCKYLTENGGMVVMGNLEGMACVESETDLGSPLIPAQTTSPTE